MAVGTCVIDANQAGNASYRPPPRSSSPLRSPGTQTITFTSTAPTSAPSAAALHAHRHARPRAYPVTFTVDPSTSASARSRPAWSPSSPSGPARIDANQAGNASYQAAPQVQQSFAVAASSGNPWPSSSSAIQANICSNPSYLQSPYTYTGATGSYTSGTAGLPTFGSPGTNFPNATSGIVLSPGTINLSSYQVRKHGLLLQTRHLQRERRCLPWQQRCLHRRL